MLKCTIYDKSIIHWQCTTAVRLLVTITIVSNSRIIITFAFSFGEKFLHLCIHDQYKQREQLWPLKVILVMNSKFSSVKRNISYEFHIVDKDLPFAKINWLAKIQFSGYKRHKIITSIKFTIYDKNATHCQCYIVLRLLRTITRVVNSRIIVTISFSFCEKLFFFYIWDQYKWR